MSFLTVYSVQLTTAADYYKGKISIDIDILSPLECIMA